MPKQHRPKQVAAPNRFPPLVLPLVLSLALGCFSLLPRVNANPRVLESFLGASAALLVFTFLLHRRIARDGRKLFFEFLPKNVHYVQFTMQTTVYLYWGWYFRQAYGYLPLIAAQIIFVYALDMLVCWSRRDKWILGFGAFPIVMSTNLFLWFKDDWFFLQFLLVATGVLGKEFIKWKRDGRFTHIFNPSAFSLCVFSIFLIATNTTRVSWAQEISTTFHNPPNIYLVIFAVGLVVQALFSVTLVTLSATSALLLINAVYTGSTGVYYFVDSNLPVAVFLGLHLLVTDPATSPRTTLGKIMFGSLYGAGVFALFGLLSRLGAPTLYDKLLCVPILNLSVQALDRASRAIAERFPRVRWSWSPRRANFAYMAVWITLFASVTYAGFLSLNHPGKDPEFWRRACQEGRLNACKTWVHVLHVRCSGNSGGDCFSLAQVVNEGRLVPRDPSEAADSFGRACDLGVPGGCAGLVDFVRAGGKDVLAQACEQGNGANCFILGSLYHTGQSVERDDRRALALFQQSCASGWARGCGRLGESYMNGEGTVADPAKALDSFEKACQGRYGPSCYNVALIYHRGIGGRRDEALALQRLQQACAFGVTSACGAGGSPAAASTTMPR